MCGWPVCAGPNLIPSPMDSPITSRPYYPSMACERCVFGTGLHMDKCPNRWIGDGQDRNKWIMDKILPNGVVQMNLEGI
jgi:hypothetical protein